MRSFSMNESKNIILEVLKVSISNPMVVWQCAHCRKAIHRAKRLGKPDMGVCSKNNGKPHRWIKMRES